MIDKHKSELKSMISQNSSISDVDIAINKVFSGLATEFESKINQIHRELSNAALALNDAEVTPVIDGFRNKLRQSIGLESEVKSDD